MTISPQFGHGNLVASVPGAIIRWQELHVGMAMLVLSLTLTPRRRLDIDVTSLYFLWNFMILLRSIKAFAVWKRNRLKAFRQDLVKISS